MALRYEEVLRCKKELGYNVVGVGAEAYVLGGYAAVFDRAIEPYLVDVGTTSASTVAAANCPTVTTIALASNPPLVGVTNQQLTFVQGSEVVVDVGPLQEASVVLAINSLSATLQLQLAHGAYGSYPVLLLGAEQFVRNIFKRMDILAEQLRNIAPMTAGIEKVDEAVLSAAEKGRRGKRNKFDDLNAQRDLARKDLAATLGVPNLWEIRGKYGGSGSGQSYEAY
jgi:hypothetical protein